MKKLVCVILAAIVFNLTLFSQEECAYDDLYEGGGIVYIPLIDTYAIDRPEYV